MVTIGKSVKVSEINLGGNIFGWTADEQESFAVLDHYVDTGGNFIDTADSYMMWAEGNSGGESETIIGRWLKSRSNRDQVVITTKVGMWDRHPGMSARNVTDAIDDSLRRLNTDYVDLYFAHIEDPETPLEETLEAFDLLVKAGKVRELGAANYSATGLATALEVSDRESFARFVALQVPYNLMDRHSYESSLRPLVVKEGLAFLPYYSLARGFLTGKYRDPLGNYPSLRAPGAIKYLDARGAAVLAAMDLIAEKRSVPHSAIALGWLMSKPDVAAPIASARTPGQLDDLLESLKLELSSSEIEELDRASDIRL